MAVAARAVLGARRRPADAMGYGRAVALLCIAAARGSSERMLAVDPEAHLLAVSYATGKNTTLSSIPLELRVYPGLAAVAGELIYFVGYNSSSRTFELHTAHTKTAARARSPIALPFSTDGYLGVSLHLQHDATNGLLYMQGWVQIPTLTHVRIDPSSGDVTTLSTLDGYSVVPGGASFYDARAKRSWVSLARPTGSKGGAASCFDGALEAVLVPFGVDQGKGAGSAITDELCSGLLKPLPSGEVAVLGYRPSDDSRIVGTFDPAARRFEATATLDRTRFLFSQGGNVGAVAPDGLLYTHLAPARNGTPAASPTGSRGLARARVAHSAPLASSWLASSPAAAGGMGAFRQVAISVLGGGSAHAAGVVADVPGCSTLAACAVFLSAS